MSTDLNNIRHSNIQYNILHYSSDKYSFMQFGDTCLKTFICSCVKRGADSTISITKVQCSWLHLAQLSTHSEIYVGVHKTAYSTVQYNKRYCARSYNKKLSCRRETARCFVSLNISLSLEVTQNHWKRHFWEGC